MNKMIQLAGLVIVAACGGSGSKPVAPANPDPIPMTDPAPKPDPVVKSDPPVGDPTPPKPDPAKVKAEQMKTELLAAETAAYEKAKPVFEKNCSRCHTKGGKLATGKKLDHFEMTTYPFGGHHAMELGKAIRKALGISGEQPTMPADKKGAVKGEDLAAIAAWADAFDASHAGGAHEGHGEHGHGDHDHDHDHKD